jgi:hypothetical protein
MTIQQVHDCRRHGRKGVGGSAGADQVARHDSEAGRYGLRG